MTEPGIAELQELRKRIWYWLIDHTDPSEVSRNRACESLMRVVTEWERWRGRTAALPGRDDEVLQEPEARKRLKDALELLQVLTHHLPERHRVRISAETFIKHGGAFSPVPDADVDTAEDVYELPPASRHHLE